MLSKLSNLTALPDGLPLSGRDPQLCCLLHLLACHLALNQTNATCLRFWLVTFLLKVPICVLVRVRKATCYNKASNLSESGEFKFAL